MRHIFITLSWLLHALLVFGQTSLNPDSLLRIPNNTAADTNYVRTLLETANYYMYNDVNKAIPLCIKGLEVSQKIRYGSGYVEFLLALGEAQGLNGNFTEAIKTSLKGLHEAEKQKNNKLIGSAYLKLGGVNDLLGDYNESIRYYRKFMVKKYLEWWPNPLMYVYGLLGNSFSKLNILDSALYYSQRSYELDLKAIPHWGYSYIVLGDVHAKLGHYSLALSYYKSHFSLNLASSDSILAEIGIATVFKETGQKDSAIFYTKKALKDAGAALFPADRLLVYGLLKDIFKEDKKYDSALFYQELMVALKDSMFARQKINQIKNIKFDEQIREIEIAEADYEAFKIRKNNLQYAAIAISLITFVVLFFTLSTSIIVRERFIRFFGIIALLLVFEFINLFIHPFISDFTSHSPIWMFLIMVCIAALLIPTHHRIEEWITHQLVEKNKRIRLAAAKKTIETLEGK